MNQAELKTDILDQLLGDFEGVGGNTSIPSATIRPSGHTSYRPKRVQGVDHNSFAQWIRSKEGVRQALQEKLGTPKITLDNCIKLYTDYNIKIDDMVTLWFPTDDVKQYREYDRDMQDGWTGKMTQEEYDALVADIGANGIKTPAILSISSIGGADYGVTLGEGNHRLRIAEQLGHELFSLTFSYTYG